MTTHESRISSVHLTRRGLLAAGGVAFIGAASGCAAADSQTPRAAVATAHLEPSETAETGESTRYDFYGTHQAGVETPQAIWQTFIGLDLAHRNGHQGRRDAEAVLRLVSDDAARMMKGEPALGDTEPMLVRPAALTITVGIGPQFFDIARARERRPGFLVDIPEFTTDRFEHPWRQTDLLLQVGADDALVLTHAVRMLTKDLSTVTEVAWTQPGFISSTSANPSGRSTRNLMGQVDGTINPLPGTSEFADIVWQNNDRHWPGSTVLVLRRIRMHLDTWDSLDDQTKEIVIGRTLSNGAPLGRDFESDAVPFDDVDADGLPLIPHDSHIAVAHAASTRESILRRPYSYDAGMRGGTNDMGLLFAAYMRDPRESFIPMQERLAASDAFNRWNTAIGSATYLIPGGANDGGFIAEELFT